VKAVTLVAVLGLCLGKLWGATTAKARALSLGYMALFRCIVNLWRLAVRLLPIAQYLPAALLPTATSGSPWLLLGEVVVMVAGAINVLRLPEKLLRHRFPTLDVAANSHQIMHVMTAGAICIFYHGLLRDSDDVAASAHLLQMVSERLSTVAGVPLLL
jgi:predicted membrane channel-forming protein YqfA (hemolysin III family)